MIYTKRFKTYSDTNSELYIFGGTKCSTSWLPVTILFCSTEKYATDLEFLII